MSAGLEAVKKAARTSAALAREAAHDAAKDLAPLALALRGLPVRRSPSNQIVSVFHSFDTEISTFELFDKLVAEGWMTALPVVIAKNMPLVFRQWAPGDALVPGRWNIKVPPEEAPEVLPDVLLVPLLAFDREGFRLGYGGGFYDRTLEKLRTLKKVTAIGIAYAGQEMDTVPRDSFDQRLDWIMTEKSDLQMRLIFLGDVVGKTGRDAVARELPLLRERYKPDIVVVNGENAAHGFGISQDIHQKLLSCGADVVTLGNHAFDQRETLVFIEREPNLIRPLNWPAGCPGRGTCMVETAKGQRVLVMNAMGRVMIEPMLDDPFPAVGRELDQCQLGRDCDAILIDFHAEASSEKMAMGHYVDGRASLLVGTHTHTPTADHQVLSGGTGYLTDAGMCGDYNSVIGMDKAEPLNRFLRKLPVEKFKPAEGLATVCGVAVETDDRTGLASQISPIRLGGRLSQVEVPFW